MFVNGGPYYLEIVEDGTDAVLASCGGGAVCRTTLSRSRGQGHHCWARLNDRAGDKRNLAGFFGGGIADFTAGAVTLFADSGGGLIARSNRNTDYGYMELHDQTAGTELRTTSGAKYSPCSPPYFMVCTWARWDFTFDLTHVYYVTWGSAVSNAVYVLPPAPVVLSPYEHAVTSSRQNGDHRRPLGPTRRRGSTPPTRRDHERRFRSLLAVPSSTGTPTSRSAAPWRRRPPTVTRLPTGRARPSVTRRRSTPVWP
ncbi:hypothetical protein [Dactylosporangium sp. CA-233914]|uniref:hypothetical protein n=1 Tax=Dactylosporangium sp. CA-233914 TaxID=3239934 RepID=UPI003D92CFC3